MKDEAKRKVIALSRRRIAENRVFEVYFDHVSWPGGKEVPDYLVVAPRASSENMITGVSILPEMEGRLGLLRLYRHAIGTETWEVPRGFVDESESAPLAAHRELKEETGLAVLPENLEEAGLLAPEGSLLAARIQMFIARRCIQSLPYRAGELGHVGLSWFSPGEALAMAWSSEIQDPSTLALVHRFVLDESERRAQL